MEQQVMNYGQIIAIIASNAVLVISAVWRLSASLQKVETQLVGVNDKMDITNKHNDLRVTMLEDRLNNFEKTNVDLQTRVTTLEVELRVMNKERERGLTPSP